ncbi:aminoglycoside phosphotransferase (APT) family kinase protein [Kribbella sp. VKM Ac-2527]|uniref:Aminoglycoside phosphotransferase (APT) family kinase protein n=1 Tax=Kribbella caucasensis TaxID=2512215 RepID=A0A4R6KA82_9ACTN|nr:phosphotransferase family protein [Kribbella sp. VKM Ac-2527]TDO46844.1 aminoglycoside phosphotransferase (APT) family kinase protein [Kribbella sp. VKM Ac-2527]
MPWDWTPDTRARLASYLEDRGVTSGEITTTPIGDGHSNLTHLVSDGVHQVVVRRPPPPPFPPGAHDVLREARVINALATTPVPVARLLATAQAGEVVDVPLYVMSFAAGPVVTTETPSSLQPARQRIGEALVDTLADLHAVDWRSAGLEGYGRPEGFNDRHRRRIAQLVADDNSQFAELDAWLAEQVPTESGASIVHNDYRIGNVVLSAKRPGELVAVLDWELATLGDPLLDLGYFLASVPDDDGPLTPTQQLGRAMLEPGYPTRKELADRYAVRTGAELKNLNWYTTLALWKLAVLYEYSRRQGQDPYYADLAHVQSFLAAAQRAAELEV